MKKFFIYFAMFAAFSATITSCSKDDDLDREMEEINDVDNPQENVFFFSCTLDGVAYETSGDLLSYGINDTDDEVIYAYGVQSNISDAMYIEIPKALGYGTHPISEDLFAYLVIDGKAYSNLFGEDHVGSVTVELVDENIITGTFNIMLHDSDDATNTVKVENGKFRVKFRD